MSDDVIQEAIPLRPMAADVVLFEGDQPIDEVFEIEEEAPSMTFLNMEHKNSHDNSQVTLKNIKKGKFLEMLKNKEGIEKLNSINHGTERQRILFELAKHHQGDKKQTEDIFHQIERAGLTHYFDLEYDNHGKKEKLSCDTALHMAIVQNCDKEVFDIILKYASINAVSPFRRSPGGANLTPLGTAIVCQNEKAFSVLLQAGADVFKESYYPFMSSFSYEPPLRTLLSVIIECRQKDHLESYLKMTESLVTAGANVNFSGELSEDLPFFMQALGISPSTIQFKDYLYQNEFNQEFALRVLSSPQVNLAFQRRATVGTQSLTVIDQCIGMMEEGDEDAGSEHAKTALEVIKTSLIDRLGKRFYELEQIFSETREDVHKLYQPLTNIIIGYACAEDGFENYATKEKGQAFLSSLLEDPKLKEKVGSFRQNRK